MSETKDSFRPNGTHTSEAELKEFEGPTAVRGALGLHLPETFFCSSSFSLQSAFTGLKYFQVKSVAPSGTVSCGRTWAHRLSTQLGELPVCGMGAPRQGPAARRDGQDLSCVRGFAADSPGHGIPSPNSHLVLIAAFLVSPLLLTFSPG